MAESEEIVTVEAMDSVDDTVVDESEIFVSIKTPQDIRKVSVCRSGTVKQLKEKVAVSFNVVLDQICLIHSGKLLCDDEELIGRGITDDTVVHMVIKSAGVQGEPQPSPADQPMMSPGSKPNMSSLGALQFAAVGLESVNYGHLQQHLQRQLLSNPDLIRQTVQNPIVRQLMMNPSVLNDLITANPQANDWLKRNPELADMLRSPEVMQQTLEISQNTEMLNELIAAQSRSRAKAGAAATAGPTDRLKFGSASVPELDSMWQKLANSPQVLQQMFSLPYTKTVLEGLEANPSLARQLIADHPMFAENSSLQQQLKHMMPQYIQQLRSPATQSLVTNPKALQALLKIQQGVDMLQSEAPQLVSSFGLPYLSVPPSLATFTPPEPAAAATDSDTESAHSNSADVMTRVMSQVIGQIADGQINKPPEERFKEQVETLVAMGFTDRLANLHVLTGTFGDLSAAVEQLNQQHSCSVSGQSD